MSINKQLLAEELKRHQQILEYDFSIPNKDVVIGEVPDDEPVPDDSEDTDGLDDNSDGDEEENFDDKPIDLDDDSGDDFGDDSGDDFGDDLDDFGSDDEPAEDEVEVDITELVKDNEETKNIANSANQKMDLLMNKFSELQGSLTKMDVISKKIEDMEIDLDKRMPSEEEKLEMRSLDSYPYSMKLTDYWSEKTGKYDVMDTDKDKEYILTQQDVEDEFNDNEVKSSFNDFEEEDIPY